MSKKSKIIKAVVFMILLACSFLVVQKLFRVGEISNASMHKSFAKEKDSLDAVYMGSSVTYSFWNPLLAWEQTGYKVFSYSVSLMPAENIKTVLEEVHHSQPDALYIIALNPFEKNDLSYKSVHFLVDYYPDVPRKLSFIQKISSPLQGSVFDKLEYYFPIIRFHSHLDLVDDVFLTENYPDYKGSMSFAYYLMASEDYSPIYQEVHTKKPVPEDRADILRDLLDYCKTNEMNVLFVASPQPASLVEEQAQLNYLASVVEEAGLPVLNLANPVEDLQLDMARDYFDRVHSNIHGSVKFTSMLCDYLKDNYNFTDKRMEKADDSWDEAYENYLPLITPYTLDFERDFCQRDNTLAAPDITKVLAEDAYVQIEWAPVENAKNYHLFRKVNDGDWERMADLDSDELSYFDTEADLEKNNTYVIVASRTENGKIIYGNCNYEGYCLKPALR